MSENSELGNGVPDENAIDSQDLEGELKKVTEELQTQIEKYKNDYLYLKAEFENYKRNAIKERSELAKYAGEKIILDLLNVIDNFQRALEMKVTPENVETFVKGVEMTEKDLRGILQKHNVTEVESLEKPFDPMIHEALGSEPSDIPPGHISKVYRKAYKYNDRILRPAQVVVATKKQ